MPPIRLPVGELRKGSAQLCRPAGAPAGSNSRGGLTMFDAGTIPQPAIRHVDTELRRRFLRMSTVVWRSGECANGDLRRDLSSVPRTGSAPPAAGTSWANDSRMQKEYAILRRLVAERIFQLVRLDAQHVQESVEA